MFFLLTKRKMYYEQMLTEGYKEVIKICSRNCCFLQGVNSNYLSQKYYYNNWNQLTVLSAWVILYVNC